MIQYATPSEHQWKFALVQPLVRAIAAVAAASAPADSAGVRLETFSYRQDRTLILYRAQRRYIVDAMVPKGQSQGLHPVPYPDEANGNPQELARDHHLQVYNSFWNGFVLGYPLHSISMYCEDFHNPLTREHKARIAREAHADVQKHFDDSGMHAVKIALGLDKRVPTAVIEAIYQSVESQ
jgi:hypothetical protein